MKLVDNTTFYPARYSYLLCGILFILFILAPLAHAEDIALAWDPNDPRPDNYRVFLRKAGDNYDYGNWVYEGKDNSCNIQNLAPNTTYHFVVRACLGEDVSGDSNEVKYTTAPEASPPGGTTVPNDDSTNPNPNPETVQGNGNEIWFDAEDGTLSGTMEAAADTQASGGQYIWSLTGEDGFADFSFSIEDTGQYVIWGLVSAASRTENSFFVSIDNGPDEIWDLPPSVPWIWDQYSARGFTGPTTVYLTAGTHTLRLSAREDRAKIDQIVITNDRSTPPGDNPGTTSHKLVVATVGAGSVTIDPPGGIYPEDTSVQVTAIPNSGWQFEGWSGDVSGSSNQLTVVMKGEISLKAGFIQVQSNEGEGVRSGNEIWFDAEDGVLSGTMEAATDAQASGGQFIWSIIGEDGFAEYAFTIEDAGRYFIWGSVSAASRKENSFFVSIDNGPDEIWDLPPSIPWIWDQYSARGTNGPTAVYLTAGTHTLRLSAREDRAKIDQIVITSERTFTPD